MVVNPGYLGKFGSSYFLMIAEQHGMSREFVFDASKLALSQEIRSVQLYLSAQQMGKLQFHAEKGQPRT